MIRQDYLTSIIRSLAWLSSQVRLSNVVNLTDINIHAENFYRDLLNLGLGYELENINIVERNAAAIDLGDASNKIAIQVTATSALSKTKHTVSKFTEKKLYEKYDRLVILNLSDKTKHSSLFTGNDNFKINNKTDIWDIRDLVEQFNNLDTTKLHQIAEFLQQQLNPTSANVVPRNVETMLKLIELISDENHPAIGHGFVLEPFPEEKINNRFSDHTEFIKGEFNRLFIEYGAVLDSVEKESDISQVKLRRVGDHLRVVSDAMLSECAGNPKIALDKLINNLIEMLNKSGFVADTGAAQFFVLKHLIKCNVFPNKVAING